MKADALNKFIKKTFKRYSHISNVNYEDLVVLLKEADIADSKYRNLIISVSAVDLYNCFSPIMKIKADKELRILIEMFISTYLYTLIANDGNDIKYIREEVLELENTYKTNEDHLPHIDLSNIDLDLVEMTVLELDRMLKNQYQSLFNKFNNLDTVFIGFIGWSISNTFVNFIISWEPLNE